MTTLAAGAVLDLIARLTDPGSWAGWDARGAGSGVLARSAVRAAPARPAVPVESVVTGEARLAGHRIAILASDFTVHGGSIGLVAARRLATAIERATREGLPLLGLPASGGTRMQDGTAAFLCMATVARLLDEHRRAGLPYLVYLRHPTTGGTLASWGSLGQITYAEPGAFVGFLGPRVHEALATEPMPRHVQRAENLRDHGLVDAVVPPGELRALLADLLAALTPTTGPRPVPNIRPLDALDAVPRNAKDTAPRDPADIGPSRVVDAGSPTSPGIGLAPRSWDEPDAWEAVRRSRRTDRPDAVAFLRAAADVLVPLRGTSAGETDPALLVAIARLRGTPCLVLGQVRTVPLGSAGLRQARRGIRLAGELRLPLVTVIDTAGAELSAQAEQGALAGEIARCLADLMALPTPTVSVLLGAGSGGAALALLPADRTIAAWHAWLAPLPPEGASMVVHRDTAHAGELAEAQAIRAVDLARLGVVDEIVAECPDAADEPARFVGRVAAAVDAQLRALPYEHPAWRLTERHERYGRISQAAVDH
ncbi:carboxyl transferase domain-containing protein [Frankia sp. AgB1.8]|uniref:carboxyl transferase domain-containing protein n=2 Tax=unclassified Frankia TaxID=2632575 RepID=UPI001933721A|nr:carboxyl transferase domain-containing protein [Frankia sp. AgB1.8]MBL7624642.1 acetyl-CoA carboxyl transferase [Frankia sp. AgB1.8]